MMYCSVANQASNYSFYKMKIFVALVTAFAIAVPLKADLTDGQKQKVLEYHKKCVSETGINVDLVKDARQGKFADDETLKKYALCMSKLTGFQNDAGQIQIDVIRQKASAIVSDPATLEKIIQECAVDKATAEETAFNAFQCYYINTPTHVSAF